MTVYWVYERLLAAFGPQGWWPGEGGAFEVAVGAVLTQNAAWRNVERALAGLAERDWLGPRAIRDADPGELGEAIRPSGYFNVKAERLQALARAWVDVGGEQALASMATDELRQWLLGIRGVGRETADDVVVYGFERPVFVVDAYTRRILARLGMIQGDEPYESLRSHVEAELGIGEGATQRLNEFHALIVALGKDICRPRPNCPSCPLASDCPTGRQPD
jgi:endonuclease-3 related protein